MQDVVNCHKGDLQHAVGVQIFFKALVNKTTPITNHVSIVV